MKIRINEKFKIGVMSLSDIIGVEKMELLLNNYQVEVTDDELNVIKQLPSNYQEAIELVNENEED